MKAKRSIQPPRWALWLITFLVRKDYLEEVLGDMEEVFLDNLEIMSPGQARRRFVLDTFKLLHPNLIKNFNWMKRITIIAMLNNHFKIAFRSLIRFKIHAAINLVGLAIGLAVATLMFYYVAEELSFDDFYKNKGRIYKVVSKSQNGSMETNSWPVGHKLVNEFPEVEAVVYARQASSTLRLTQDQKHFEHNIHYASADFFKIFSFEMVEGNRETALNKPYSIVITEDIKQRYFKNGALGEVLTLRDTLDFEITGVVKNPPHNSHIQFDMLISFDTYEKISGWFSYTDGWGNFNVRNYILLKEGSQISSLESKASSLYMDNLGDKFRSMGMELSLAFVPLKDIYLKSGIHNGFGPTGSEARVQMVTLIAVFMLLLACINYTNLSTARSANRAKEVGMRKVAGSSRTNLVIQFLIESFVLTLMAFFIGLALIRLGLPFFNQIMEKHYTLGALISVQSLLAAFGMICLVALLAGLYPAFYISRIKPLTALSGKLGKLGSIPLRKVLIVFQFFTASAVVLFTLLVIRQINFMQNQDLGFDKEQVLIVDASNLPKSVALSAFKTELLGLSGVSKVSFCNALPGHPGWQGQWAYAEKISEDHVDTEYMAIDEDYLSTLGLNLIAGRNFDKDMPSELQDGLIINETCVKAMGWESPQSAIGKKIVSPSQRPAGTVIGVVKDYHGLGLQNHIWPKAMAYSSDAYGRYFAIRFQTKDVYDLIKKAKDRWDASFPDHTLNYSFLDEDFERQYNEERQLAQLMGVFTVMILIISAIGLLGLVSFVSLSKTKEIGIRKTLGASISQIIFLLSKDFMLLVVLGNLFAIPLVWYLGKLWLENFAYSTTLQPGLFVLTVIVTLAISFITVGLQTLKTARTNPSISLRYE